MAALLVYRLRIFDPHTGVLVSNGSLFSTRTTTYNTMKPINAAQRRGQFLRFVLLFLLAMLPVVVFMYLFGRNESRAYEALKNERNDLRQTVNVTKAHDELLDKVFLSGKEIQQHLNTQEADLLAFNEKKDGDLRNDVRKLEDAFKALLNEGGGGMSDERLAEFAKDYATTTTKLLDVYVKARDNVEQLQRDKREYKDGLEEKVKAYDQLQLLYQNCMNSRPR